MKALNKIAHGYLNMKSGKEPDGTEPPAKKKKPPVKKDNPMEELSEGGVPDNETAEGEIQPLKKKNPFKK